MKSKQWLEDVTGVQIPDSDSLQADACGPAYTYNNNSELVLERKDQMRRRGVPSPDEWEGGLSASMTIADCQWRDISRCRDFPVADHHKGARRFAFPIGARNHHGQCAVED